MLFKTIGSTLRIVIDMTAISMGIDCLDIRRVFHHGPPRSVEEYVQETGRAGRDGTQSHAILLYGKPSNFVTKEVRVYRRTLPFVAEKFYFNIML